MKVPAVHSIAELYQAGPTSFATLADLFDLRRWPAVDLRMNDAGWRDTRRAMPVSRAEVEQQALYMVRDRHLGTEAVFNPLRGMRQGERGAPAAPLRQPGADDCRWCDPGPQGWHVSHRGMWADAFGEVVAADGRWCARANWARQAPVSGIVYGEEHDRLRLSSADFAALMQTAQEYVRLAAARTENRYFAVFWNGGARSAASVAHAHVQVIGRRDRHFAYPERVAAVPGYLQRVRQLHEEIGLGVQDRGTVAWAHLCPVKEKEVVCLSESLAGGAAVVFKILSVLRTYGTNSWSLAAILRPEGDERFAAWPPVVWRLVDRGDMRAAHADIGSVELLLGTSVVATDPFLVAGWLQGQVA